MDISFPRFVIASIHAVEVLDSRSRPTLRVSVGLADGAGGWAGVPSGASTGSAEAVELRDEDPARYGGQGVLKAVNNVNEEIAEAVVGREFVVLSDLDQALTELDGTADKSRLGANALKLVAEFPIWSIEDGLGEQDRDGWVALTARLGGTVQLVGDDNLVTNPRIIAAAIDDGIANAALIKLNQIGTVTETLEALRVCRDAGYAAMISHRSGETTDPFIADLAVAAGCGQIKTGAPARGERVAKYNRLLTIAAHEPRLDYGLAS